MKALLIKVEPIDGGVQHSVEIVENDGRLEAMQKAVDGYIECVGFQNGSGYVNEDGKTFDPPLLRNSVATTFCFECNAGLSPYDHIAGNMIVYGPIDDEGYNTGVTDEMIAMVKEITEDSPTRWIK